MTLQFGVLSYGNNSATNRSRKFFIIWNLQIQYL